ncbi:MAG TPA: helix-turn-helix transcriptional regulator [Balneolaceae bacterium]|nr:helix-turn-helix transcriptional regulator [Balneolaceae bacterium]
MASLGKDLATLRKERNLSLDDIHEATKIPKHILLTIEDNSIFTEYDENITYIRSYVRSYARALSIDDQQIVYALDKEELGSYSGSLLKMADEKADDSFDFEDEVHTVDQPAAEPDDEKVDDDDGKEKEKEEEEDTSSGPVTSAKPETSSPEPSFPPANQPEKNSSVDWVNMGHQFEPVPPSSKMWIGVLIILILGAGGLYYFISGGSPETPEKRSPATSSSQPPVPADSLKLDIVPLSDSDSMALSNIAQNNQPAALKTLPDTLHMVVYAAYGKLEPVRVFTDIMNSINPYWIEKGEAMRFNFVNRFRLRGQFDNLVLMLNGHVIENYLEKFYETDSRLVEIHRSFFENSDKWLQPAPDRLSIDAPPPSVIQDHPTFDF